MGIGIEEERLREIEQDQAGLRASIDDAKRLAERADHVLDKRRVRPMRREPGA